MNAGFSNLASLKSVLLPFDLRSRTDWDTQILALAQGVAAEFENALNRKLAYVEGDTWQSAGNFTSACLPRFPIADVASIEEQDAAGGNWMDLGPVGTVALSVSPRSGVITFGSVVAPYTSQIRITFSGGFFWETLEPADQGYPSAAPNGAPRLPGDIVHAWHLQCIAEVKKTDLLRGSAATRKEDTTPDLNELRLLPAVVALLRPFVRYAV